MFKIDNTQTRQIDFEPIPDAEADLYGIFAQDEIFIGDTITLTIAARYDHIEMSCEDMPFKDVKGNSQPLYYNIPVSDAKSNAFTYNLGFLYALTPNVHLTANSSSGFRAPTFIELYAMLGGRVSLFWKPGS